MTISAQTPDTDPATRPDLAVPLDTVCYIIEKAREFDVKAGSTDPDAPDIYDDDVDAAVLEDRPSDPVESELRSVIRDLSEDAQIDLVTLMWLGRDDGSADEWDEVRQIATDEHNTHTAKYLVGTPLLSVHLEAGLEIIGISCAGERTTQV